MRNQTVRVIAIGAGLASALLAQMSQRQAAMTGGGSPDRGKCTIEVVVDSSAQVEVRGTTATLRTLSGQPAQWRRFECTGPLPANPANFRFAGVDGRGRQELVRDPRNGGVAVVQIDDKDGGAEGYTFDLFWDARGGGDYRNPGPVGGGGNPPNYQNRDQPAPGYQPNYGDPDRNRRPDGDSRPENRNGDYYRRYGHGFGVDEAIRVCQQAVFDQAARRYGTNDIHFHRTAIDDNPGRQDWVTGTLDVHRRGHEERYGFSCSVNFDNGRIRSAELSQRPLPEDRWR